MKLLELLKGKTLILDGAMGTMLQDSGLQTGENPVLLNIKNPEAVKRVHQAYLDAGAALVLTNTFGANRRKLPADVAVAEVVTSAVRIAREAVAERSDGFVALDIGPIGELLQPNGMLSFDQAYAHFQEQIAAGAAAGADAIYIETMTDLLEAKCAVLAAKENCDLPVICTMSFDKGLKTFMGADVAAAALTLDGLGVDCIGINCSVGPAEMLPTLRELMRWTNKPIVVKPNAGLPSMVNGCTVFEASPDTFASAVAQMLELGVSAVGGCCGTTPEFIRALAGIAKDRKPVQREPLCVAAVCSASTVVRLDRMRVVGERINPTGKPALQEALDDGDIDTIVDMAIDQEQAGADIIDVNLGHPGIDEAAMMAAVISGIQASVRAPLQIDAMHAKVFEAGLRAYNGKPVLNSVTGDEGALRTLLPLARKYGAVVVGMTMDKNGIPDTVEGRVAIARRIVRIALEHGIPLRDIIIDCLTLSAGTDPRNADVTLAALELVKMELGVNTMLGISNVSYGMPERRKLNQTYLALALARGLDLPIMDPLAPEMMDAVCCYRLLSDDDPDSQGYIRRFVRR